jgi:hypothetical protein
LTKDHFWPNEWLVFGKGILVLMCHVPDQIKVIASSHNRANDCTGRRTHHELGRSRINSSLCHGFEHTSMERNANGAACP